MRDEIEQCIKEQSIDRSRFYEVGKQSYSGIIKKIERTFVKNDGSIHWANMGYYKKEIPCLSYNISEDINWYYRLPSLFGEEMFVYALFEGCKGYEPKYWLYEARIPELVTVIGEVNGLDDFYIVSKKFRWLISENHEEIVSCLGDEICWDRLFQKK